MCFCVGLERLKVGHFHCLWAPQPRTGPNLPCFLHCFSALRQDSSSGPLFKSCVSIITLTSSFFLPLTASCTLEEPNTWEIITSHWLSLVPSFLELSFSHVHFDASFVVMKRRGKKGEEAETQLHLSTFPFCLFRVILKTHPKDFNIANVSHKQNIWLNYKFRIELHVGNFLYVLQITKFTETLSNWCI